MLVIKNLVKNYGKFRAVDNLSLEIGKGQIYGFVGANGAGKTTFITALSGKAYFGKVVGDVYFNREKISLEKHNKLVGFVPQDDIMLREMTVYETIYFAARTKLHWRKNNAEVRILVTFITNTVALIVSPLRGTKAGSSRDRTLQKTAI